ncbi:MAG: thiamine phosphate synthase [Burkholderiales bacterium]
MKRAIRGLYAITPDESDTAALVSKVRQALHGGALTVQYRNKVADPSLKWEQAQALLLSCRAAGVPLIINDDLELALAVGADGLHLGSEDGGVVSARARLGPHKLLGTSCYDRLGLALAAQAAGADYVAFGSVFPSSTKSAAVHAPLKLFREAGARIELPMVAIGGITPDNAGVVVDAGAAAVAVISALFDAPDIEAAARRFCSLFQQKKS